MQLPLFLGGSDPQALPIHKSTCRPPDRLSIQNSPNSGRRKELFTFLDSRPEVRILWIAMSTTSVRQNPSFLICLYLKRAGGQGGNYYLLYLYEGLMTQPRFIFMQLICGCTSHDTACLDLGCKVTEGFFGMASCRQMKSWSMCCILSWQYEKKKTEAIYLGRCMFVF